MMKKKGSRGRRIVNFLMMGLVTSCTIAAVSLLLLIVGYIASRGLGSINLDFFIREPKPFGEVGGGIAQAILGTVEILAVSAMIAMPIGVGAAIYLSEIGKGIVADVIRLAIDIQAGLPSIVIGVFVWALIVRNLGSFSGLAGAVALAIIMIPLIGRSVEEVLKLVPQELREAGLSLGMSRFRVTVSIVIPTVLPGIVTCIILAMARAAGETAPLLLTTLGNNFFNFDLRQPMAAMPLQIYNYAISPYEDFHAKAFAATILLIGVVALFSASVRLFTRRFTHESS